jgi:cytoskeletal protein RodZ
MPLVTRPQTPKPSAPPLPAPPPPPAPMAPPFVQTAPPPAQMAQQPASRRGLYMALGSVATLVVLIAAVIEGPKLFNGGSSGAQTQSLPSPGASPSLTPQAPVTTPPPSPIAAQPPQTSPPASSPVAASVAQPVRAAAPQLPPAAISTRQVAPTAAPITQPVTQTARPAAQAVATQPVTPQPAAQPAPQPVAQTPVPAAPQQARPPVPSPELNELRERYNLVSIRASTVKGGLSSMEQQMARQGLNLRGDIREANTRMDYMMQESMAAIRAGDVEGGKRNLQMAERALETIEKFLGR